MLAFLKRLVCRRRPAQSAALQPLFQEKFKLFETLLAANHRALEQMARLEELLWSGRPFGVQLVRRELMALMTHVRKMTESLIALADGRYAELTERLAQIEAACEQILSRQPQVREGPWTLELDEVAREHVDLVGGKMANLGELRNRLDLRVPDGFIITASADAYFHAENRLEAEIDRRLQVLDTDDLKALYAESKAIRDLIRRAPLPPPLEAAIQEQLAALAERIGHADFRVALRSSALHEDGAHGSFAGQYRTYLNVEPARVCDLYRDIIASKYQNQALIYQHQRGYRHQDIRMAVGCLEMVAACASGVAFTRPPDDPDGRLVVIHAACGLGDQIADGISDYDRFLVTRSPPFTVVSRRQSVPTTCLGEAEIKALTQTALRIEAHYGVPLDIEWAIDDKRTLHILQARPLEISTSAASPSFESWVAPTGHAVLLAGGEAAGRGAAAGNVFKVASDADALEFPKGAVLVVATPYPEWAMLISRAVALISETGQSACHLATVAREFGIPALFGLTGAMKQLENGQLVTVSASARQVLAGRVEELLATTAPTSLMAGSPLQALLKDVLAQVTPLSLTDPAAALFKATNCRTLHDITRFCHEKALQWMFDFGRRHGARDKTAKRLYVAESPSQWWVVDLKDGLRAGLDPALEYVRLEDIVCRPMLALWAGMTAVPWEGPPPVNMRGLGAIIAQSAMNPQLEPSARSRLADRNYFLVSKNYCHLSTRLGYHYAHAEANFSDSLNESYASFQFQGGAADVQRRCRRVALLGEMLQEQGFRVEIEGDCLTARIEKLPAPELEKRLVILGYLIMHARQVDMAMEEQGFAESFAAKLRADIRALTAQEPLRRIKH